MHLELNEIFILDVSGLFFPLHKLEKLVMQNKLISLLKFTLKYTCVTNEFQTLIFMNNAL